MWCSWWKKHDAGSLVPLISVVAPVEEGGPLLADVMCVSVLAGHRAGIWMW